jgi:DNA replicative helicase MCM subunit Mcm2 (Cdc46/Mcm family)
VRENEAAVTHSIAALLVRAFVRQRQYMPSLTPRFMKHIIHASIVIAQINFHEEVTSDDVSEAYCLLTGYVLQNALVSLKGKLVDIYQRKLTFTTADTV